MQSTPEFAVVGSYRTATEAYAAKHFLEVHGLRAFILDEHSSTEGWWNALEVKVQVPMADTQRALELLTTANPTL